MRKEGGLNTKKQHKYTTNYLRCNQTMCAHMHPSSKSAQHIQELEKKDRIYLWRPHFMFSRSGDGHVIGKSKTKWERESPLRRITHRYL